MDEGRRGTMSTIDPFGRTDQLGDAMLEALVARFEARGQNAVFARMLDDYLDRMELETAQSVLDMGCGTGLAARSIAKRADFSGHVTGVDLSAYLVAAAQRFAREEDLQDRTRFQTGDTRSLDREDDSFDAVVAHTLLSHVERPASVLQEAARVLRSGGLFGVFDGDYASLTFDNPDEEKGRQYDEALIAAVVTNPRVMRQMPRMLKKAGFQLVYSSAYVLAEVGTADFWASAIEAYRRLIPKAGILSEVEADAWAAGLRNDSTNGTFFGSTNYYAYVARKA
jgi:ubiquinone/menaquinone biosynthesis C-methylase UbiE